MRKKIVIIAGPNGAGKTTFAKEYLPTEVDCNLFVNADEIAAGISSCTTRSVSIRAGKRMLEQIDGHVKKAESFAFETTLSGRSYEARIPRWRKLGYEVKLIFLSLPKPEMAIARVKARVAQGGHDIAENVIRRRFIRGWQNFDMVYRLLVDAWVHYDNSFAKPVLCDKGRKR